MSFKLDCCQPLLVDLVSRETLCPVRDCDIHIYFRMYDELAQCELCHFSTHVDLIQPRGMVSAASLPATVVVHAPHSLFAEQCGCVEERLYRALLLKVEYSPRQDYTVNFFCVKGNYMTLASESTLERIEADTESYRRYSLTVRKNEDPSGN